MHFLGNQILIVASCSYDVSSEPFDVPISNSNFRTP